MHRDATDKDCPGVAAAAACSTGCTAAAQETDKGSVEGSCLLGLTAEGIAHVDGLVLGSERGKPGTQRGLVDALFEVLASQT